MADRPGPSAQKPAGSTEKPSGSHHQPTDDEIAAALEKITLPRTAGEPASNESAFGIPTQVTLNVFRVHMEKAPGKIIKYDLQFLAKRRSGKDFEVNNALIKVPEHIRTNKRNALTALLRAAHESDKEYFRRQQLGDPDVNYWRFCCAFDCGNAYFTAVDLPNHKGEIPEDLWKGSESIQCFLVNCVGPVTWELKKAEEFRIDGEHAKSPQALAFITILANQHLSRNENITVMKDAAYLVEGEMTSEQKELRKGIVAASRCVGKDVCIQMDSKIGLFFKAEPLLEYIREFSGQRGTAELAAYLMNPRASEKLRKELSNLPLMMRHLATQRTFESKGLHTMNAMEVTFSYNDRVITIADYFLERYQYRLKHPQLPLILERKGSIVSYHPIECLDINKGVRVSNKKMSWKTQEEMISKSCRAPAVLAKDLEMSRDIAQLNAQNKYLNAFEVKIKDGFCDMPAKILSKPLVSGMAGIKPEITEVGKIGFCKGASFKFAHPAKPDKAIVFFVVDNAIDSVSAEQLKSALITTAMVVGMTITFDGPSESIMGGSVEEMRETMMKWTNKASMFFFVTPQKMDENHHTVKKLEQELGVVTQLIFKGSALDIISDKRVTRYNIVAKMNQKLGGVVVNPEVPPELKTRDADAHKKAESDWFKNRMFIGLSLSHAGAQSYADRVVGEEVKEPSCVGMAFTLAQPGKRTALSWFIEKRRPIIDDIGRHFIRALDVYAESNKGKMPSSILVFRNGMSEGELNKAGYEMRQLKEAIIKLSVERNDLKDYRPTLQCLVCMSNTSDRLFYQGGTENVPAGTVLEKEATNPERAEFIIVAHNAIKGTSKPVRCTVAYDQKGRDGRRLTLPELQSVYHSLCYLHGIAASPTRLPVPLSDSEKAAERQMNNYKEAMQMGLDLTLGGTTMEPKFYQRLSDSFGHHFKSQYYA